MWEKIWNYKNYLFNRNIFVFSETKRKVKVEENSDNSFSESSPVTPLPPLPALPPKPPTPPPPPPTSPPPPPPPPVITTSEQSVTNEVSLKIELICSLIFY